MLQGLPAGLPLACQLLLPLLLLGRQLLPPFCCTCCSLRCSLLLKCHLCSPAKCSRNTF
jgi:hypothetical protein